MIYGKYFSYTAGSVVAGQDLISLAKTRMGTTDNVSARKMTVIASGSLAFSINGMAASSTLFQDVDLLYKLSLDADDVIVKSFVVNQTSACPVFVAMVF